MSNESITFKETDFRFFFVCFFFYYNCYRNQVFSLLTIFIHLMCNTGDNKQMIYNAKNYKKKNRKIF